MTTPSANPKSESMTTRSGRGWLQGEPVHPKIDANSPVAMPPGGSRDQAIASDNAQAKRLHSAAISARVSVTIPDVSSALAMPVNQADPPTARDVAAIAKSLAEASQHRLNLLARRTVGSAASTNKSGQLKNTTAAASKPLIWPTVSTPDVNGAPERKRESGATGQPNEIATRRSPEVALRGSARRPIHRSHLAEARLQPDQAVVSKPQSKSSAANSQVAATESASQLEQLVDRIQDQFPANQSTVLLIVGSEANPQIDTTCAQVSAILARRRRGKVLLVDSHLQSRQLSISSGADGAEGFVEAISQGAPWRTLIRGHSANGVDFLPIGTARMDETINRRQLRQWINEVKQDYPFICVSGGISNGVAARLWSNMADGCYLLVSLKNSNPAIAQSAVAELQSCGARLLGCVVTDVLETS